MKVLHKSSGLTRGIQAQRRPWPPGPTKSRGRDRGSSYGLGIAEQQNYAVLLHVVPRDLLSGSSVTVPRSAWTPAKEDVRATGVFMSCQKVLLVLILFLFSGTSAFGARADDYFAQQLWRDALTTYKKTEFPTTKTLERMGTCAAHLKRHADAVLYWRRAQRHSVWGQYLYFGRMVAGAQSLAGVARTTHPVIAAISNGLCAVPLILWQLLLLMLWGLLLWRGKRMWKQRQTTLLSLLIGSMIVIGSGAYHCYSCRTRVQAVVVSSAPLRTGPNDRYSQLSVLTPASEVALGESRGKSYKVVGSDRGWIESKNIRII